MLISNGVITRNIAEKQLPEYEARGYKEVTEKATGDNVLKSMKFDELKALAESMGIDISEMKSKAAVIEAIEKAKKDSGEE